MSVRKATRAEFDKAVAIISGFPADGPIVPAITEQLFFYKYYKQATVGDINTTTTPGLFEFTKKAKLAAWESVKSTSQEDAWTEYVNKLREMLKAIANGEDEEAKTVANQALAELDAVAPKETTVEAT